jgi:hypothetical protein
VRGQCCESQLASAMQKGVAHVISVGCKVSSLRMRWRGMSSWVAVLKAMYLALVVLRAVLD